MWSSEPLSLSSDHLNSNPWFHAPMCVWTLTSSWVLNVSCTQLNKKITLCIGWPCKHDYTECAQNDSKTYQVMWKSVTCVRKIWLNFWDDLAPESQVQIQSWIQIRIPDPWSFLFSFPKLQDRTFSTFSVIGKGLNSVSALFFCILHTYISFELNFIMKGVMFNVLFTLFAIL